MKEFRKSHFPKLKEIKLCKLPFIESRTLSWICGWWRICHLKIYKRSSWIFLKPKKKQWWIYGGYHTFKHKNLKCSVIERIKIDIESDKRISQKSVIRSIRRKQENKIRIYSKWFKFYHYVKKILNIAFLTC